MPHIRARATMPTELDVVEMRRLADPENDDELVLAPIK
jgi:hypothetical protein